MPSSPISEVGILAMSTLEAGALPEEERARASARSTVPPTEVSLGTSLEHLLAGSQGLISKRFDLALLEGENILARGTRRLSLAGTGMILLAGAILATTGLVSLLLFPAAQPERRLAAFAVLNAACAFAILRLGTTATKATLPVLPASGAPSTVSASIPRTGE
jgi:uncharacterized membrane protein YqjE